MQAAVDVDQRARHRRSVGSAKLGKDQGRSPYTIPAAERGGSRSGRHGYVAWGAELASGEGRGRIYVVEPTGDFEDDPNLTDKKFPGNPTQSFRSHEPLRVVGELVDWVGHSPEKLDAMRASLQRIEMGRIED